MCRENHVHQTRIALRLILKFSQSANVVIMRKAFATAILKEETLNGQKLSRNLNHTMKGATIATQQKDSYLVTITNTLRISNVLSSKQSST